MKCVLKLCAIVRILSRVKKKNRMQKIEFKCRKFLQNKDELAAMHM